jgi:hypothetical protein
MIEMVVTNLVADYEGTMRELLELFCVGRCVSIRRDILKEFMPYPSWEASTLGGAKCPAITTTFQSF